MLQAFRHSFGMSLELLFPSCDNMTVDDCLHIYSVINYSREMCPPAPQWWKFSYQAMKHDRRPMLCVTPLQGLGLGGVFSVIILFTARTLPPFSFRTFRLLLVGSMAFGLWQEYTVTLRCLPHNAQEAKKGRKEGPNIPFKGSLSET